MRALLTAISAKDLPNLTREIQNVANTLGELYETWLELNLTEPDQLLNINDCYDLVWLSGHTGPQGWMLSTKVLTPTQLAQFLIAIGARQLVLNSCFSAEHVLTIQRSLPDIEIVATIDPNGVNDAEAWQTGVYLARALIRENGALGLACYAASAAGVTQYRYFPPITNQRALPNHPPPTHNDPVQDTLNRIQTALMGDPLSTTPGMVRSLTDLERAFRTFSETTERRLQKLESTNDKPVGGIPYRWFILTASLYVAVVALLIYLSMA